MGSAFAHYQSHVAPDRHELFGRMNDLPSGEWYSLDHAALQSG